MEKILNYLDSVTATEDNTGLATIYTELTGIVADANNNIKARITRKENAEKEANNK